MLEISLRKIPDMIVTDNQKVSIFGSLAHGGGCHHPKPFLYFFFPSS